MTCCCCVEVADLHEAGSVCMPGACSRLMAAFAGLPVGGANIPDRPLSMQTLLRYTCVVF
jgi:hypothetical protein